MSPTPTPAQFNNATSSFASSQDLTGVLLFVIGIIGLLWLTRFVVPWVAEHRFLSRLGRYVATSLALAVKGAIASAAIAAVAYPIYWIATADSDTHGIAMQVVAIAIGGYIGLVVIGWMATRVVAAFIEAHPDYDTVDDILPDADDEGGEPA